MLPIGSQSTCATQLCGGAEVAAAACFSLRGGSSPSGWRADRQDPGKKAVWLSSAVLRGGLLGSEKVAVLGSEKVAVVILFC